MMAQVNAGRVRFVGRGEYNNSTQYYVFDLVNYNGNSYYAKVDTIGHLPTDTTYWQLVAEKGNVGPTGLTGNGISSIEKTSTSGLVDTYTITYTNGNTTTFDVSNGNGIDRIEKTATVGNKDTYTIYFTNGSTTTYEVSNGEVTREELEEEVDRLSMIYNAFPSTTGEVEEGSINGTAEVPFKEIGLKGNTSQNGEPTPDTPIPVNVVTGDNEVKVEGKNLFDYKQIVKGSLDETTAEIVRADYVTINSLENNTITITTTAGYRGFTSPYIKIKPNTNYTFSIGATTLSRIILTFCYYDENKTFINLQRQYNINDKVINQNASYVRFSYEGDVVTNGTMSNIMLEQSSTKTEYEPYQSQTYSINLGSMELCKIGDYQDYLYKENDKWYKYGAIGKVVLDGSENYLVNTKTSDFLRLAYDNSSVKIADNNTDIFCKCNNFKGVPYQTITRTSLNQIAPSNNTNRLFVNFSPELIGATSSMTSSEIIALFKNWLSTHNTTVYYPLATPTITPITDTTLIEQLDNLEKAYSYDTQTNISQTNQDKPFIISYEAILSLRNVLNS